MNFMLTSLIVFSMFDPHLGVAETSKAGGLSSLGVSPSSPELMAGSGTYYTLVKKCC